MKNLFGLILAIICSCTISFAQEQKEVNAQVQRTRIGYMHVQDSRGKYYTGILFENFSDQGITYEVYVVDKKAYYKVVKNDEYSEWEKRREQNGEKNINYAAVFEDACISGGEKFYLHLHNEIFRASHH